MRRTLLLVCILSWAALANAQQELLELARSDIRSARMGLVAAAMELTPEQQKVFWPPAVAWPRDGLPARAALRTFEL